MRPVEKFGCPQVNGSNKVYKQHSLARGDLENNLGYYCSYCEVFSSDLEVEHVISRHQDSALKCSWDNFLLACGRCNGRDNKASKAVDMNATHFPHRNNTFLSFTYQEGGYVSVNPLLEGASAIAAETMLNLVGLDKFPGNIKYAKHNANDTRWNHRRVAWELAVKYLPDFESGRLNAEDIVSFARQRGFFSVWYAVYHQHRAVRELLIQSFPGTATSCFDAVNCSPVPRNPKNTEDPV
ncbi:HNH endonuclease [Chitinophaga sp. CF418]|uniref:HNH endonuclease n=1 Tax=Chitinophaga sp. CF418 TaxID=1855287 RepID=UPI000911C5DF|nr:HNH endonuclease [Chitinophaga sp. CF418]SHN42949.1 HNH endonuclease [Chitinophaga sp. CF418]